MLEDNIKPDLKYDRTVYVYLYTSNICYTPSFAHMSHILWIRYVWELA
jgi:hypothetical protein